MTNYLQIITQKEYELITFTFSDYQKHYVSITFMLVPLAFPPHHHVNPSLSSTPDNLMCFVVTNLSCLQQPSIIIIQ